LADFYRGLTSLKHAHPALWNGVAGGPVEILPETTRTLLAFSRSREDDRVTVLINFSRRSRKVAASERWPDLTLKPFGYMILEG